MGDHHRRDDCRGCGGTDLYEFLDLGLQPLANAFVGDDVESEATFPLVVSFCRTCSMVGLRDVVDPEVLFRDYIYVTGTSETIAKHNVGYAKSVVDLLGLGADDLVIEAASNDGSLLKQFKTHGVRVLGVEPARNIAKMSEEAGVPVVCEFLSADLGPKVRADHGPARAVIGNNVLAHVDDINGFVKGAREMLSDDGLVIFEFPWLGELVERLEYDTVYHEHLSYLSLSALMGIFDRLDMVVHRVDRTPVHGGSLRVHAGPRPHWKTNGETATALLEEEKKRGLVDEACYRDFSARVEKNREDLLALLNRLKGGGKTLAGYAAPAKGNTLLNYCGIGTDFLPYTVDRAPMKVGKRTPGMHIPVVAADELAKRRPDYTLILAWNFAEEIQRQQSAYREAGGRFIVPIPEPKILEEPT